jgi:hypothetical protein
MESWTKRFLVCGGDINDDVNHVIVRCGSEEEAQELAKDYDECYITYEYVLENPLEDLDLSYDYETNPLESDEDDEDDEDEDEDEDDEDLCPDCGSHLDNCDCDEEPSDEELEENPGTSDMGLEYTYNPDDEDALEEDWGGWDDDLEVW